uniref:MFS transporter n=1 Tax=Nonomuraea pusilla TaxID=46177 RepID=UPI0006E1ED92|nr:glycoside-pentoside-hexuronide (GPH):cation symporter [Nonomuraea pusilla]
MTTARVRSPEKAAFFAGNVGNILFSTTINAFLLIYLTDEIGLTAAAVGTLFLVARLVDGVSDPVMGYVVDHLPVTRWGRFRAYLLVGGAIAAVTFAALFLAPAWSPAPLAAVWAAYLLWGFAFDLMDIPLNALIPVVAVHEHDRRQLSALKASAYLLGGALVTAVALPLADLLGWQAFAVSVALVSLLLTAVAAATVRERVRPVAEERYGPRDLARVLVRDRAVVVLFCTVIALAAASGARSAGLAYYFTYYVGDPALIGVAALATVVPTALGTLAVPRVARRLGYKAAFAGALAVEAAAIATVAAVPASAPWAAMTALAVTGFGAGGALTMIYVVVAELADYCDWKHGFRLEGGLAALGSFAAKTGGGVGAALTGYVLSAGGYLPGQAQSAGGLRAIVLAQSLLPAGLALLGALAFTLYPITKDVGAAVAAHLAARRERGELHPA